MKFKDTIRDLICEVAHFDRVIDAIRNKKVCIIYYDGDEPGGKGIRIIEPVCLGTSKRGNKVLRAWDYEGASHRGYTGEKPLPGWRMFRLDKILVFRPTGENFEEIRPNFNPNGDKSMKSIIIISQF